MNQAAVDVALRVNLQGSAGAALGKEVALAEAAQKKLQTATERAAKAAQDAATRGERHQRTSYERMAEAREVLGVRGERVVQREIQRTEAAYNRLLNSGTMSLAAQANAAEAMRKKVAALNAELGKTDAHHKKLGGFGLGGAGSVGAAGGFVYGMKAPLQKAIGFDERLAHMANTAYAERDVSGRKIGMKQLEAAVNESVDVRKGGGGTREQAAEALDAMIASNAVSAKDAMTMLPQLMRTATATGANPEELAQIGIRAMQTMKIKAEDLPNLMNMAVAGGQAGGFELKDMAHWLPQQMAAASSSGLSGKAGFAKLVALNQASVITAGTKNEAGNNLVNWLSKINSHDTANDAKKLGVNLPAYLMKQREAGVDSTDAFIALVDKTVAGRADYKALQGRLEKAKTNKDEAGKKEALESMAQIAQGAGVGKLIQDRQALMALMAVLNNRPYYAELQGKIKAADVASGGAVDQNYELIGGLTSTKLRAAEQAKDIAQKEGMDKISPAIGKAADLFTDLAQKYPMVATGALAASTSLIGLAGAAVLSGAVLGRGGVSLSGGGGLSLPGLPGAGGFRPRFGTAMKVGAAGLAVSALSDPMLEHAFGKDSTGAIYGQSAINGASTGATIGAIAGPLGAVVGGAIGLAVGPLLTFLDKDAAAKKSEKQKLEAVIKMEILDSKDARVVQSAVKTLGDTDVTFEVGNVMTGAM